MQDLNGQVAWVTGAGTGIGESGAIKLAQAGVKVILSGRRKEKLDQVAETIIQKGGEAVVEVLNIADSVAVHQVVDRIERQYSQIDILVNSAGVNIKKRSWNDISSEGWDQVVDIDLNGAFYCCKAVLPIMKNHGGGLIINISSWAGRFVSTLTGPAYTAAKHAMNAMTSSLIMEESKHGIRACAICPGEVATPILDERPVPVSDEEKAKMLQAEDLGETILFVAKMPPHVCLNEILISPTANRAYQ